MSVIAVRADWICVKCEKKATTHQAIYAFDPQVNLPVGWTQRDGDTYCPSLMHQPGSEVSRSSAEFRETPAANRSNSEDKKEAA